MYQHGGDVYSHPNFIDFSANINLLGAPQRVIECAKAAINEITHYPQVGYHRLRQAIAELEQVESQQIICGNGAAEVFFTLVSALKPKKALLYIPTFQEYEHALKHVNCQIVYEYLREEQGFQIGESQLQQIDNTIDMVFFCNPNNPTGILTRTDFLEQMLKICKEVGAVLVVDECFLDFVLATEELYSMKNYLEEYLNLFIVKAFTKTFGMPGLRLGYGLCKNKIILEKMKSVTQPWNVSVPAQEAGIAAAQEKNYLIKTRLAVEKEKTFLLEQLLNYQPQVNQMVLLKSNGQETNLEQVQEKFFIQIYGYAANFIFFKSIINLDLELKTYGILIRNCSNFQGLGEGGYRIAVRTRKENQALIYALEDIRKKYFF